LIVSEIGDVMRFPSSGKLCAYAGLVPSVLQLGVIEIDETYVKFRMRKNFMVG